MPNLALTDTKRITVFGGWWYGPCTYVLFFDIEKGFIEGVAVLKHMG